MNNLFLIDTVRDVNYDGEVTIKDEDTKSEYTLTFHRKRKAKSLEVDFYLPQTDLWPGEPLEGTITLHNTGDKARVRFHISVKIIGMEQGLKPYTLESASPQLNYTPELPVKLKLYHPPERASRLDIILLR